MGDRSWKLGPNAPVAAENERMWPSLPPTYTSVSVGSPAIAVKITVLSGHWAVPTMRNARQFTASRRDGDVAAANIANGSSPATPELTTVAPTKEPAVGLHSVE
jgi:hypothetical protein